MATAKERIRALLDELPEEDAALVERLLLSRREQGDEASWRAATASTFASWFSEEEYEYPAEAGAPS